MDEPKNNSGEDNKSKYIAFGVCFGLLIGTGIGVIAGVLTETTTIMLPLLSGVGLVVSIAVALYLANNSNA